MTKLLLGQQFGSDMQDFRELHRSEGYIHNYGFDIN